MMYALGREIPTSGHAAGPGDRARGRQERQPVLVDRFRDCIERCIPHAGAGGVKTVYLTKKHLSRRMLLKGAGVSLALPLLDAMIPAHTALAQTAAARKLRAGFFYMPHGAIMWNTAHGKDGDRWTPSGAGADFKLSHILEPLEPYKHFVTSSAISKQGQRRLRAQIQPGDLAQRLQARSQGTRSQHDCDDRPDHCRQDRPGDCAAVNGGLRGG